MGVKLMKSTPDALKTKLPKGFGELGSRTMKLQEWAIPTSSLNS